jgi:hypothetical protein
MEIGLWFFMLGYFFQLIATSLLIFKILKQRSIFGLCWDTQLIFLLGSLSRVFWQSNTRLKHLPLHYVELYLNVILLLGSLYLCYIYRYTSIHKPHNYTRWQVLIPACCFLAFCFHPGSKNEYYLSGQMLVSFTMFTESAGLIPQLLVMRKAKEIEVMTGRYVLCLGIARFFRLLFWIMMFITNELFFMLIAADLLHSIVLIDFSLVYFKNIRAGKLILP